MSLVWPVCFETLSTVVDLRFDLDTLEAERGSDRGKEPSCDYWNENGSEQRQ